MKRFITYLFTYENKTRGKNVGFVRADERNELLDLEIHLQGLGRFQGTGQIYLLLKGEQVLGIRIGEILIGQGRGVARAQCSKEVLRENGVLYDAVAGVVIRMDETLFASSCWLDTMPEEMISNSFVIWKKESEERVVEDAPFFEKNLIQEELVEEETVRDEPLETDAQSELVRLATEKLQQADNHESCEKQMEQQSSACSVRKIDLSEIRKLPKKNWYLCNNSFLIHGFFNYHYLVVIELEENGKKKSYLGVPGIYEKPERMMAMLFGFGDFRPESEVEQNASDPEGKFGYWICLLDV